MRDWMRRKLFLCPGEMAPWWAGLWYRDWARNGTWVLPVPLNLVMRPLTLVWWWVCWPFSDSLAEERRRYGKLK